MEELRYWGHLRISHNAWRGCQGSLIQIIDTVVAVGGCPEVGGGEKKSRRSVKKVTRGPDDKIEPDIASGRRGDK